MLNVYRNVKRLQSRKEVTCRIVTKSNLFLELSLQLSLVEANGLAVWMLLDKMNALFNQTYIMLARGTLRL